MIYGISHVSPGHSRANATSLATGGATGATGLFLLQALGIAPLGPFSEPDLHSDVQRCPAMDDVVTLWRCGLCGALSGSV